MYSVNPSLSYSDGAPLEQTQANDEDVFIFIEHLGNLDAE
jgi:hypothetical protein